MNTLSKIPITLYVMFVSLALVSSPKAWRQEPDTGKVVHADTNSGGGYSLAIVDVYVTNLYLPIIIKEAGLPSVPMLYDIDNADGDGSYTINWSTSNLATSYTLEEDDHADFPSPTGIYSGTSTTKVIVGNALGYYYYRVKAENSMGSSGWSEVKIASVTKVSELICETHNFGTVGSSLLIPTTGTFDHFTAENNMLVETLEVKSMLKATFPTTVYVAVGINGVRLESTYHAVSGNAWWPYYMNRTNLANELHVGDDIYYYISRTGDSAAWIGWGNYVKLCGR